MKPVEITLATYLERLAAQLGDVPLARRAEILDETKSHLEAMIAARRADGMDENEAWRDARNAFGEAETIGRELAREWNRAPRVEKVGTPLSKREKLWMFARPTALFLLFYGFFSLMDGVRAQSRQGADALYTLITFGCGAVGLWRWRRAGGKWTSTTIAVVALFILGWLWVYSGLFDSPLRSPFWSAIPTIFIFGMIIVLCVAYAGVKRTNRTAFPWRQTPQYRQNPIKAEELYRLSPRIQLVSMTMTGCLLWLLLGWKYFGFAFAVGFCVGEIALAYLYARWLDRKIS